MLLLVLQTCVLLHLRQITGVITGVGEAKEQNVDQEKKKPHTRKSNLCGKYVLVLLLQTPDQTECCFVMLHDFTISAMNLNIYSRIERA